MPACPSERIPCPADGGLIPRINQRGKVVPLVGLFYCQFCHSVFAVLRRGDHAEDLLAIIERGTVAQPWRVTYVRGSQGLIELAMAELARVTGFELIDVKEGM
jgi:hypothetical protein